MLIMKFDRGEWIRTTDLRVPKGEDDEINNLAGLRYVTHGCHKLLALSNLHRFLRLPVASASDAEVHMVGIVLAILDHSRIDNR
jgi:hypothetical protein